MAAELWPAAAAASGGKRCSRRRRWRLPRPRDSRGGGARATLRPSAHWAWAQARASRPPERGVADDERRLGPAKPPWLSGRPRPRPKGEEGRPDWPPWRGAAGQPAERGHVAAEGVRVLGEGWRLGADHVLGAEGPQGPGHVPRLAPGAWLWGRPAARPVLVQVWPPGVFVGTSRGPKVTKSK
ncbi:collagen alpha-1(III) chain-like [Petaurus breviceps papuanus]|uniref:collagen alpha-1(III) chain-like n=1 Tax=Petaurus breviceps papuanus TaxID=3040969 RepID=UPI0036DE23F9